MEFQDAVKYLRKELNLTQAELGAALKLSTATVNRWEKGRTIPSSPATVDAIRQFAKSQGASPGCRKCLREALDAIHRESLNLPDSNLFTVERESICHLVDDSVNAIYVSDLNTDEILYANRKAEEMAGSTFRRGSGQKCYEFLRLRNCPCPECPKTQMDCASYSNAHIVMPDSHHVYHFSGKMLNWNGRKAHVQYFYDETLSLNAQGGLRELLDTVPVGICRGYLYDDGRVEIEYLNEGYYLMTGTARNAQRDACFSVPDGILSQDREAVMEELSRAGKRQGDFDQTFRIARPDGTLQWLNVRGRFIGREMNRTLYTCVITDAGQFVHEMQADC